MKKALLMLFVAVIALGSCKKDGKSSKIKPPKWIHGTWHQGDEDGNTLTMSAFIFKFTKDDIVIIQGVIETSYKDMLTKGYKAEQSSTNDSYNFKITHKDYPTTISYKFSKYKSNIIKMHNDMGSALDSYYVKQ